MAQCRPYSCLRRCMSLSDALPPRTSPNGLLPAIHSQRRKHSTTPPPPPPPPHSSSSSSSSVSSAEMTHFASLASTWWDPLGPSRILHLMNPLRHDFIASCVGQQQQQQQQAQDHGQDQVQKGGGGLRYLDVGCGGGIFAESLARTIHTPGTNTNACSLLAIDPSPVMIELALSHARKDPTLHQHLRTGAFEYRNTSLEDLTASASTAGKFDVVTLFEVLEHVDPHHSSPRASVQRCLDLVAPGGWLVGSTIARTLPAYVVNQVIAEAPWPIGVVPRGTHEWSKFVNPEELRGWVEGEGGGGEWRCVGAMYAPGMGWRMVPGAESWGNYFWGIRRGGKQD
ncbi:3-demethylubiquinone-9 3-O-methyltransferase [Trichophyton rubrum D6]|uniref:Ubiquinone biosynthesis O-methyltransferase, mitochondrial n=2 Tax=Trichophyton rubrum TaxID=5551 RepID=A0A178F8A5_TRIRU|nr:3-demethylubiquinone-9 3-O-methyltransferase [Trichophyton rubrum CBS 118892]EZF26288.1 3-demethylubiquinone-9 3-O-methyltransferase [Trichophyton rubrum MR850]EZF45322.1 3-demethylubiquinone-9 3-O-methyltransferase [Trichophyton rubrum CBS 100081]EZF66570.1 3-demethylubiquinone-9 3-O-methyltransferase [Trichophyton rubrum CBS 289.86]EZF87869.1 3-demethylubiquinone-9 3-O-methyltransferase [Trichophyton rubrum MR1448]EZF98652.1 3-demethylubiquinone-9 3-O-methyltransferase [Trichophyton rubru